MLQDICAVQHVLSSWFCKQHLVHSGWNFLLSVLWNAFPLLPGFCSKSTKKRDLLWPFDPKQYLHHVSLPHLLQLPARCSSCMLVMYLFSVCFIGLDRQFQVGWSFGIMVHLWDISQCLVKNNWMKTGLKIQKGHTQGRGLEHNLNGWNFKVLFIFTFPIWFSFAFFLIILPEVYLLIRLFQELAFILLEPFYSLYFFLFNFVFIYFGFYMSVLSLCIRDCLNAETIANHSSDEASWLG